MKKLQLFTGGHPNSLDDYEHIQEGHIESLNAVIAGLIFPNTACILTGCVFNGTTLTAGTVFYQNEVFYVDAQSLVASVNDVWFVVNEMVRNNTSVTYLDTVQRNVHLERKAELQAGGGDIQYNTILRLENILYTRLGVSNLHYTKTQIDSFFAAFRNGYDPTFRINPVNSHLEWSYASPSHPNASGTTQNPWRDLGFPVRYYLGTGGGLFESRINVNQILPPQPNQRSFIEFNNEIADEGNVFNLGRTYTIPVSGEYEFGLDQVKVELVNDVVPNTNTINTFWYQTRITVSIWKNGVQLTSANSTVTNGGSHTAWVSLDNNSQLPYEITDAVGTQYILNGDLRLKFNATAGEEITAQVSTAAEPTQINSGYNPQEIPAAENTRIAYRIVEGRFYTV